eukprot:7874035-Pyramimonas_sp.AAC.1
MPRAAWQGSLQASTSPLPRRSRLLAPPLPGASWAAKAPLPGALRGVSKSPRWPPISKAGLITMLR